MINQAQGHALNGASREAVTHHRRAAIALLLHRSARPTAARHAAPKRPKLIPEVGQ